MPLILTSRLVARAPQLRSPLQAPHKKSTSLQGIKKKEHVVVNELDEYFKLPREDFGLCEPLNWWRGRRSQFPRLYQLVIDIFSIPGKACMICIDLYFLTWFNQGQLLLLRELFLENVTQYLYYVQSRASLIPETVHVLMLVKQRLKLARVAFGKADQS